MLTTLEITALKSVPIAGYLASLGFHPVKAMANELQYFSPLRTEKSPSFFVRTDKNVFTDFGGEKGDVIRLVSLIRRCSFIDSVKILQEYHSSGELDEVVTSEILLVPSLPNQKQSVENKIKLISSGSLRNKSLIVYAEQRGIPFLLAAKYCQQVHYENRGRKYYSIGFKSDKGGFELRNRINNKNFKACIAPKSITTIKGRLSTSVALFEGFFDFLAALVFYQTEEAKCDVIVLNSTSNLSAAIPFLKRYKTIYTYLDNDKGGQHAKDQLLKKGLAVTDKSFLYADFTDLSEMVEAAHLGR